MGTHYKGTAAELRALDVYIKLMRAADSIAARLERRLVPLGLSEKQFGVLETLLHLGPLTPGGLGHKQFTSGGNVTTIVDNLEKRGLVKRVRGRSDRRTIAVHLTAAGRKLIHDVLPGHVEAIVAEMSRLAPAEQRDLERLCKKVGIPRAKLAARRAGRD